MNLRIATLREIVSTRIRRHLDGGMIDLFSAEAILAVYDALSSESQERYSQHKAPTMARIAFQLLAERRDH